MSASIKDYLQNAGFSEKQERALFTVLTALQADASANRTAITGTLAKLDADAGVTDTNYVSTAAIPTQQTAP